MLGLLKIRLFNVCYISYVFLIKHIGRGGRLILQCFLALLKVEIVLCAILFRWWYLSCKIAYFWDLYLCKSEIAFKHCKMAATTLHQCLIKAAMYNGHPKMKRDAHVKGKKTTFTPLLIIGHFAFNVLILADFFISLIYHLDG